MPGTFNVELCITDKCNLGCPYCYVANKNKFNKFKTYFYGKYFDRLLANKLSCALLSFDADVIFA